MIPRTKRFLQALGAVPPDFQQTIGELGRMFVLYPLQPLADRFGDRFS